MNEQEIVDQFVEVVTNNVGAISSTRLNSQVLLTFVVGCGFILVSNEQTKEIVMFSFEVGGIEDLGGYE